MSGGEGSAGRAGASLHDDGRALGRRLADMRAGDFEVLPLVVDFSHEGRVGVDTDLWVELHGVGAPGRGPELVNDLHVFFADGVALVVLGLLAAVGEVAGGAVEVACYDVPSDSGMW